MPRPGTSTCHCNAQHLHAPAPAASVVTLTGLQAHSFAPGAAPQLHPAGGHWLRYRILHQVSACAREPSPPLAYVTAARLTRRQDSQLLLARRASTVSGRWVALECGLSGVSFLHADSHACSLSNCSSSFIKCRACAYHACARARARAQRALGRDREQEVGRKFASLHRPALIPFGRYHSTYWSSNYSGVQSTGSFESQAGCTRHRTLPATT